MVRRGQIDGRLSSMITPAMVISNRSSSSSSALHDMRTTTKTALLLLLPLLRTATKARASTNRASYINSRDALPRIKSVTPWPMFL